MGGGINFEQTVVTVFRQKVSLDDNNVLKKVKVSFEFLCFYLKMVCKQSNSLSTLHFTLVQVE